MNQTFTVDITTWGSVTLKEILDVLPEGCDPALYTVAVQYGGDDASFELEIVGPAAKDVTA